MTTDLLSNQISVQVSMSVQLEQFVLSRDPPPNNQEHEPQRLILGVMSVELPQSRPAVFKLIRGQRHVYGNVGEIVATLSRLMWVKQLMFALISPVYVTEVISGH